MKEKKKVLIITYYWPPSGGAGVQRWLKFAKYLPEYGIDPIILTVDSQYASYPQKDESLGKDISSDLKVYKTKSFEPLNLISGIFGKKNIPYGGFSNVNKKSFFQTILRFIRGNFFIPDARVGWNKHALKKALELIKKDNIKTIITTGPPHSTHLVGLKLKKKLDIQWISDFRDPWTDIYYYKDLLHTRLIKKIDKKKEKKVLERADQIITVGNTLQGKLEAKINNKKIVVISNGYDEEDFKTFKTINPEKLTITYTGTLSDHYIIDSFIKACNKLKNEGNDFTIRFVGNVSDSKLEDFKSAGLYENIELVNYVPHHESIEYLYNSSALLLVIPDFKGNEEILTGKLFEYLATGKPIVGIGPKDGDANKVIQDSKSGEMFDYTNVKSIYYYLKSLIENEKQGGSPENVRLRYSRKNLTKQLEGVIKNDQ